MAFVDLSMAGLQGQQAFADRTLTLAQAKNTEATAKVNEANAAATMFEMEEAQRMADLDQQAAASLEALASGQRPPGSGVELDGSSAASPHEHLGNFYIRAGAVERGTKLLEEASKLRKAEADIENDRWLAQQRRLENIQTGAEVVSQNLGIARNESEWRVGLQRIRRAVDEGVFVMEPELLEQLENMPYDPEAAAYFNQAAIDAKGRAELEIRQQSEARQAAVSAATLAQGNARLSISAARLAETQRHNAQMEKHAGRSTNGTVTVDATGRDAMAARLVAGPMAQFKDPVTGQPVERNSSVVLAMATTLEEDARILARASNITLDQARERAIQGAIANGELEMPKPDTGSIFNPTTWGDDSTPGGIKRNPNRDVAGVLPIPASVDQMIIGRVYDTVEGPAVWDGESFVIE